MQIFGIDLWRILTCIILIYLVVMRANIVAIYAKKLYAGRDYEKSLKVFSVADKVGNLNVQNKLLYGYVLLRVGRVDDAVVQLRAVQPLTKRKSPQWYQVKNLIGLAYWKRGELADAIEELEEIIADDYKTTQIYQNLGILYNLSDDTDKALRFNLEAYEYNSDDNIIVDNLADCYSIRGEYEKAAELYGELVNRDPEPRFPEAYYGYGKVLAALGDTEKGIEMVEKALTKPFSFLSVRSKEEVESFLAEIKK